MNPIRLLQNNPALSWIIVLLYASIIFYLSSMPATEIPKTPVSSTILHIIEYFGLGLILIPAVKSSKNRRYFIISLLILSVYAASDEFHQNFVAGRVMSMADWIADCAGGLAGLFLSEKSLT
jgi:VanZ family protein